MADLRQWLESVSFVWKLNFISPSSRGDLFLHYLGLFEYRKTLNLNFVLFEQFLGIIYGFFCDSWSTFTYIYAITVSTRYNISNYPFHGCVVVLECYQMTKYKYVHVENGVAFPSFMHCLVVYNCNRFRLNMFWYFTGINKVK